MSPCTRWWLGRLCEIRAVSLPQYAALSYTWGPFTNEEASGGIVGTPTHHIYCNGQSLLVTENLYFFLIRLPKNSRLTHEYMWVDIICINQDDAQERSSQVNLMAQIYNFAESVLVWLGEEHESTEKTFDLIKLLEQRDLEYLKNITPRELVAQQASDMAPYEKFSF